MPRRINPPEQLNVPRIKDLDLFKFLSDLKFIVFQLWQVTRDITEEISSTTDSDITATDGETIICNNTALITVTLPSNPEDKETMTIKRFNTGGVNVVSTVNIDNSTTQTLPNIYDSITVKYISDLGVWIII